jgi:glutamyl-tRNA synthetase
MVRTRFAPSPTGFMHLGVLRTALYAWLYARKNNGTFILRIEDTDQARYVEGAVDVIYDTLKTCGLDWDEGPKRGTPRGEFSEIGNYGPYFQSERKDSYMKYAEQLIEKGAAYRKDGAIFQKASTVGETSFKDEVFGEITVNNSEIEDQVLIKSDGMPTYNFANVIDDHLMQITHIIRGSEFLSSTPKYIMLYEALGWTPPVFIHVAPIMRDANNKLSKRDGDAYFSDFIDKGYLIEAVINYIALLGWSPRGEEAENEFFTLSELVEAFDLSGISKSPAIFDEVKMRAINAQYIRNLTPQEFKQIAKKHIPAHERINLDVLAAALQPRVELLTDITAQVDFIEEVCGYELDLYNNKKMKTTPETALTALGEAVRVLREHGFDRDEIFSAFKALADDKGVKAGYFLYPLQVALTGRQSAPGGGLDICIILGRDEAVRRIEAAIERLNQ